MACMYLLVAGIVVLVSKISAVSDKDLTLPPLTDAVRTTKGICEHPGFVCSSCTELTLCIQTEEGFAEYTGECATSFGYYCNPSKKECSLDSSFCKLKQEFQCGTPGTFPDPYNCNYYYKCTEDASGQLKAEQFTCAFGTAYNARTFACDLSDTDAVCKGYIIPLCPTGRNPGLTSGAVGSNPNLYYMCHYEQPILYKCPDGSVFDPVTLICVHQSEKHMI